MLGKPFLILLVSIILSLALGIGIGMNLAPRDGIPIRVVADYLHAILQADRTFYTQHVVERMEAMLLVTATENWREERTLPLPAQFFKEASRGLQVSGNPFRYRLVSLWPLNPENTPKNEVERKALEKVVTYGEVAEQEIQQDNQKYYQAIFPDRAVSRACINCHNAHPDSPKRDFKLNDVMGGLEILIPLD
ncbi:MAG: DUF3365 domain-containing protein [Nitrospirales bacterium]|nr:DUF3365 domain-containing protein [Nitrospirales bacterium]